MTSAGPYRALLAEVDGWFDAARLLAPGIPCTSGCTACCHGPFDISVADVELLAEAVSALPARDRAEVRARAASLVDRMQRLAPRWREPWDIGELGEERFDQVAEALADQPCPLLDDAGRCRIHPDRPLVCRLLGLGMVTPAGRVLENACPIQERFPGYAALAPFAFDLEAWEDREALALEAAAVRLFGDPAATGYETTIAAAILAFADTDPPTAG